MRPFLQYLLSLLLLIAATFLLVPRLYGDLYPKPPGPKLDPSVRTVFQKAIDKTQPQIVLIGDSLASTNIDPVALSKEVDKSVYDITLVGSASTLWYLVIKNDVATAEHRPAYLMILFRDTMLTTPDYRVQGNYFQQIDEFANPDDKLLIQLAFINKMNWLEKLADQYLPPYGSRQEFRATIDGALRDGPPGLVMGCDTNCVGDALSKVFRSDKFLSKVMGDAINSADDYLYTGQNLDFSRQLDRSFLPDILRLCRENNIKLILVRSKTYRFTPQSPAPAMLGEYIARLAAYATQNDVIFLDFSQEARLTRELYVDPDHLNAAGRVVFTRLLSQSLAPFIH